ncbi:MAG: hypothetical protein QHH18_02070 [Candidatus Bathyarchaeota archaeon]|jgi:hypothetical protein|nr:hypothetical protein [Candidatus Bathyarchaeota archaeon A05DMB-5]MDH7557379.1 hypothetical protein [Candidatus Bathyarchaeota archaeon]
MEKPELLDTWRDFSDYWSQACSKSVDKQIALWRSIYMKKYPELLSKQLQTYEEDGLNWKEIAKKIFPSFSSRFTLMQKARNNIIRIYKSIYSKAAETLTLHFNITFVVYVGIGCGAGWATTYKEQPAILLGLENIAEEKWHTKQKLEGLISHEIGHLAHMNWRGEWQMFERAEKDPLFQLYSEGFAQRCEHIILGKEIWHLAEDKKWLPWCKRHESWLAKEFLKRIENQMAVEDFFGSWFSIQGRKQTGYFLGHEFIRVLEENRSLRKIAILKAEDIRKLGIRYLNASTTKNL